MKSYFQNAKANWSGYICRRKDYILFLLLCLLALCVVLLLVQQIVSVYPLLHWHSVPGTQHLLSTGGPWGGGDTNMPLV